MQSPLFQMRLQVPYEREQPEAEITSYRGITNCFKKNLFRLMHLCCFENTWKEKFG